VSSVGASTSFDMLSLYFLVSARTIGCSRPARHTPRLHSGLRANGRPSPTRRVLVEPRGRRCTSASARPVSGLLSLSGLKNGQTYRVYDYYAHHSPAVDSPVGSTMGWELPAQQLPTSRHGITAGRPQRTEAPSSCQPPATLTTRRYSGLSPNRTNTRTSEPGSSCARVGRNTSTSGGTCRTRKHLHLSLVTSGPSACRHPARRLSQADTGPLAFAGLS
jgi:hypothetical protein